MTLPVWDTNVPVEPPEGWQMPAMYLAPEATEMDGGNQRLRSKPGSNVAVINYPLKPLTDAQYALFETFVRTTLNNGTSRWTMSLWTGTAFVSKTVQFDGGKSPTVSRANGFMYVTLPLRVYGM